MAAAVALQVTAPTAGDFWWSDAPRHALNGAFVLDFLSAAPIQHPVEWAVHYYLRYPALTIMFYPPLFYVAEAAMFAVFGVHHVVAQATVILFALLLMWASYRLASSVLPRVSSLAVALLVAGVPGVAFWARQVMLDIPAYALVTLSAWFFVSHASGRRPRDLYLAAGSAVAAIAVKQNAAFVLMVLAFVALLDRQWIEATWSRLARVAGLVGLGLLPLIYLTYRFGTANMGSVVGRPGDTPRTSLITWLYYLEQIPTNAGVLVASLAIVGVVGSLRRAADDPQRRMRLLLASWFVVAYAIFSFIGNHEPRHGLMMLWPVTFAAVFGLQTLFGPRYGPRLSLVLALGVMGHSLVTAVPPRITGYDVVARYVAALAPKHAVVAFHGARDGNFIFAMRADGNRPDVAVVRTDKLLVKVLAGERLRGVEQTDLTSSEIDAMIRRMGVDLLVVEPEFWSDLRQMARFRSVMQTGAYEEVARFPIDGTLAVDDKTVVVYRPTYHVQRRQRVIELDMPMLRGQFSGPLPSLDAPR